MGKTQFSNSYQKPTILKIAPIPLNGLNSKKDIWRKGNKMPKEDCQERHHTSSRQKRNKKVLQISVIIKLAGELIRFSWKMGTSSSLTRNNYRSSKKNQVKILIQRLKIKSFALKIEKPNKRPHNNKKRSKCAIRGKEVKIYGSSNLGRTQTVEMELWYARNLNKSRILLRIICKAKRSVKSQWLSRNT